MAPTSRHGGGSPRGGTESVAHAFRECVDDPVRGVRRLATSHAAMQVQRWAMLSYETAKNNVGAVWRKYQSGELFSAPTFESVKIFAHDLLAKAHVQAGRAHLFCVQSLSRLPPPLVAPLLSSLTLLLLFLLWSSLHSPTTQVSHFAPPSSPLSSLSTHSSALTALNPSSSIFTACQELLAAHGRAVSVAVGADEGGPGAAAAVAAAAAATATTAAAAATAAAATTAGAAASGSAEPLSSQNPQQPAQPETQSKPVIPGSTLLTEQALKSFEQRFECLATQGIWDLDSVPRQLPWFKLRKGWSGWECDAAWSRQASETGNLAFTAADAVADEARHAREWQVRDAVKYRWRVHRRCGRWGAVERGELARRLAGRRVLMVGDETSAMLFLSLRNHMLMPGVGGGGAGKEKGGGGGGGYEGLEHRIMVRDEVPDFCARLDLRQQQDFPVCTQFTFGDSASVLFVRDDVLRTSPPNTDPAAQDPAAGPADASTLSLPWFDQIKAVPSSSSSSSSSSSNDSSSNISVLILNRGSHFVEDDKFIPQLNETLTKVRATAPDLLIIYRSTPPGHAHCDQLLAPITERQDPSSLPNHWGEFVAQNEWAKRLVKAVGGVFLDVDPMTALRPDGHIRPPSDCLQYCLPGPPDEWTRMLYHMLLDLI